MKTAEQMKTEGMSTEDIEKALKEQGLDGETLEKALAELDALTKSDDEESLDDMIKALEEHDNLLKSDDGDADDEGGDSDKEDDEDEEGDDMDKSLSEDDLHEELVKASEAYAELEDTIHKSMGNIDQRLRTIEKSQMAALNLQIKMAKALAGMTETMTKSIEDAGAGPAAHRPGFLGAGKEPGAVVDTLKKSKSEIAEDLQNLVVAKKVDAKFLSIYAVKGYDALPDFVKSELEQQ
jgi:Rad3-related DNA helicase